MTNALTWSCNAVIMSQFIGWPFSHIVVVVIPFILWPAEPQDIRQIMIPGIGLILWNAVRKWLVTPLFQISNIGQRVETLAAKPYIFSLVAGSDKVEWEEPSHEVVLWSLYTNMHAYTHRPAHICIRAEQSNKYNNLNYDSDFIVCLQWTEHIRRFMYLSEEPRWLVSPLFYTWDYKRSNAEIGWGIVIALIVFWENRG